VRNLKVKFSDGVVRSVPFVEPMRPKATEEIPEGDWIAEEKYDGSLTLMYLGDGAVAYVNRKGRNKTLIYPELVLLPKKYRGRRLTIIQGEVYAFDGRPEHFEQFLRRDLLQDEQEAKERSKQIPLYFGAYDILMSKGEWVTDKPILERKKILSRELPRTKHIKLISSSRNLKSTTSELEREHAEGVVYKKLPDGYESGDTSQWKKLKFRKEADVVVTGYNKGTGRRSKIGALRVGVYKNGKVVEVANVGTGFTDEELTDIKRRLDKGEKVYGKVEYQKVGSQGRLRAPAWKGRRTDITVKETHL